MLTIEKLQQSEALKGLEPAILSNIVALSQADEISTLDSKIGERIGQLHSQYDKDVKEVTGIDREPSEKSYDYVKRVLTQFKNNQTDGEILTQLETLKAEKTELENKIKSGNVSEAVKEQLQRLEEEKQTLTNTLAEEQTKFNEALKNKEGDFVKQRVSFQVENSLKDFKFNENVPESARKIIVNNAKTQLFEKFAPEYRNIEGVETLTFKDVENNTLAMQEGKFKTVSQILKDGLKDIIIEGKGKQQPINPASPDNKQTVNLSSVTSQRQADDIIRAQILERGIKLGTSEYTAAENQLYSENKEYLTGLPIE